MSNETKWDVFEKALREWDDLVHSCGLQGEESHGGCEFDPILIKYKKDYDAAMPDDLPVIPKAVGEILRSAHGQTDLLGVFETARNWHNVSESLEWIYSNQDAFARAWIDGYTVEE